MPSLTPKGTVLFEEGGYYTDSENRDKFLEVSTDGFIQLSNDSALSSIVLELKCPFPNDLMPTVHYAIPVYCTIQLLCHLVVKKVKHAWYGSYSKQSTVVLELKFDEHIWQRVISILKEIYDKEEIAPSKKKVKYQQDLKESLQKYFDENTCIIGEVLSFQELEIRSRDLMKGHDAHTLPQRSICKEIITKSSTAAQLRAICRSTKDRITEAYELQEMESN